MDTQAIQFGMMNSLRTNNVVIDTLVCLLLPVIFTSLLNSSTHVATLVAYLQAYFGYKEPHTTNHILKKAISIYLSDHLDMKRKSGRYELLEKVVQSSDDNSDTASSDSDSEDDYWSYYYPSEEDQLKKLSVGALPPINEWIEIDDGLFFMHEMKNEQNDNGDSKKTTGGGLSESTVTFLLQSHETDASQRIDAFVNRAYANYQAQVLAKHTKDKTRYMYIGGTATTDDAMTQYKRYALGEDKTFESLFFEETTSLLHLVDWLALALIAKSSTSNTESKECDVELLNMGHAGLTLVLTMKAFSQLSAKYEFKLDPLKIEKMDVLESKMQDMQDQVPQAIKELESKIQEASLNPQGPAYIHATTTSVSDGIVEWDIHRPYSDTHFETSTDKKTIYLLAPGIHIIQARASSSIHLLVDGSMSWQSIPSFEAQQLSYTINVEKSTALQVSGSHTNMTIVHIEK
ncbi:Aste57867_4291 [Aphanomyces stellatus]|uniref:Aste57867_4291 protein n=1 Tax=Aphanomyces stellatus TaxID=120398 RepID=A0A485KCD8_9STRA|nr:hypothetical protein As57867_004280 [Aphanomyces stellatus]VFT81406.1 Aste57867_4291 [Aphanomyces stellatus]